MRDVRLGAQTVHTFITPQAQPGWAIKDGNLYVAGNPQVVAAAIREGEKKDGNITGNDAFAALLKRLGAPRMSGFEFADLPKTAPGNYARLQLGLAAVSMIAAGQGIWVPANLLPPLEVLQKHLAPGGKVMWVDATGWHSRGVSPFPGSRVLANQEMDLVAVGTGALMVSILLPSLNRARETANRVKCASNERQIGRAILLYSNDHRGAFPPDLGTLIKTQDIGVGAFACPSSDNEVPASVIKAGKDVQAKWVDEHSSYIYIGQHLTNSAGADQVVVYEKAGDHNQDGINLLYGDGHVAWESMPSAQQQIQKAKVAPR